MPRLESARDPKFAVVSFRAQSFPAENSCVIPAPTRDGKLIWRCFMTFWFQSQGFPVSSPLLSLREPGGSSEASVSHRHLIPALTSVYAYG